MACSTTCAPASSILVQSRPTAFEPGERRTEAMKGWLDRAREGSVAGAYRKAWKTILKAGKEDLHTGSAPTTCGACGPA